MSYSPHRDQLYVRPPALAEPGTNGGTAYEELPAERVPGVDDRIVDRSTDGGRPGTNLRTNVGMDFEPEYIAVDHDGSRAFVTLQDANGVAILDLKLNAFTEIIGLGVKDFSVLGNEIDPKDTDGKVEFVSVPVKGLFMPDGAATYKWRGSTFVVMANEGDFRGQRRSIGGRKRAVSSRLSAGSSSHLEHGFVAGEPLRGRRPVVLDSR